MLHVFEPFTTHKSNLTELGASIAQWIRPLLTSFISSGPGFESQANHQHFFVIYFVYFSLNCETEQKHEKIKIRRSCEGQCLWLSW